MSIPTPTHDLPKTLPGVNFPFMLAPMVGLSHVALRRLVRSYLPAGATTIWPTEMLNSRRLPSEKVGITPETLKAADEGHLHPQILGNEEPFIAASIQKLEDWGAKGIDINMGCPVRKALKHNYGVALMGDADYAAEVVAMAVRNTRQPVSVKLRAGLQGDEGELIRFIRGLKEAGASWICLHPRKATQLRRGSADWSQIALVKKELHLPVVGNGDVQTASDALAMLEQTGCDGVMIGRALTARPWLFWQLGHRLGFPNPPGREGVPPMTPLEEGAEYGRSLLFYFECIREHFPEPLGLKKFRFHVTVSHVWFDFGHSLFAGVSQQKSYTDLENFLKSYFSRVTLRMSEKTNLRY